MGAFRNLALGGAACWVLAQALGAIEAFWDDAYHVMELVVPEEALETTGFGLFALSAWALLTALRRHRNGVAIGAPTAHVL